MNPSMGGVHYLPEIKKLKPLRASAGPSSRAGRRTGRTERPGRPSRPSPLPLFQNSSFIAQARRYSGRMPRRAAGPCLRASRCWGVVPQEFC